MKSLWKLSMLLSAAFLLATAGCSDDGTPTDSNGADTDPPVIKGITVIDGRHLDVEFDENVLKESAERPKNYTIIEKAPPPASEAGDLHTKSPGDTVDVKAVSLKLDKRTISISTDELMGNSPYDLSVTGVADLHGNKMTSAAVRSFTGTGAADNTSPEIVFRSPSHLATGVGTAQPVVIQFSELVYFSTVMNGLMWTYTGGSVQFDAEVQEEVYFILTPKHPLNTSTTYTVSLVGVLDLAGNLMPSATWSFTTTPFTDTTPPTLVASSPQNMATNVNVNSNLSLLFSETIDQTDVGIFISPNPGDGIPMWSDGGKTLTFDPDLPLLGNTQYNLLILPGEVRDLAGNGIADPVNIRFTTGASIKSGIFAGTISGDPTSNFANDPTGTIVIAADRPVFDADYFDVGGSDIVGGDDTYTIRYLPDDVYFPVGVMDSNDNNDLDPDEGDAVGAFGIDLGTGDMDMDSVIISGGNTVTDVDFQLFDPSAMLGTVSYEGAYSSGEYYAYIGVFDTVAFDPTGPPDAGTREYWPYHVEWRINSFEVGLDDGVYYIGAFLDLNGDTLYDPSIEPSGFYGGYPFTPVVIEGGSDAFGIHIIMADPSGGTAVTPVKWPTADPNRATWFRRIASVIRRFAAE